MVRWIGCGIGVVLVIMAGCNKRGEEGKTPAKPRVEVKKDNNGKPIVAQPVSLGKAPKLLPFNEAVILDPPPDGERRPPNKTHTGKNAIKIFETIATDTWDKVNFIDNDGKRVKYQAVIATELGDIRIDLLGRDAPNHVRSFVSLAKNGYYDGMSFYRSVDRQVVDARIAYIETGCPRGTGEVGSGSIGYWLRPEFSATLKHTEGVVGASLSEDPESAACRFHITATAMPQMDGRFTVFGKVTQGLDIVRTINKKSVQEDDRLAQPVLIKNVTIQTLPEAP